MFYGTKNEETKKSVGSIVENIKEGADGKMYGIVYEGTKYYIKSCEKGKENLKESFDYIGGWMGRKQHEYSSFAKAVKNMDMMLMSLNEDYHKRLPINEAKKNEFKVMDDSMVEMQDELTRYGQILENIDQIYMNKKSGIGDRNIGVPEAPKTQEYNSKVGGPFDDTAKYEANRDNKENSKDHKKEGGPFDKDGSVDSSDMQSDKLNTGKGDDVYDKKAQYAPDGAVAAMNPAGGKVVRVNEDRDIDDDNYFGGGLPDDTWKYEGDEEPVIDLENDEAISGYSDDDLDAMAQPTEDGEVPEAIDLAPADGVSNGEEIAGIDDMSGVNRDITDGVIGEAVNEAVEFAMKRKGLDSIVESVVKDLIKEDGFDNDGDRYFMHDSDFEFQGPNYSDGKKQMAGSIGTYLRGKGRVPNLHKNPETGEMEFYDEKGPNWVNPQNVDYENGPHKGENKYGLNLNDDPMDDDDNAYMRTGAWEDTAEMARKYADARVSKAQEALMKAGYTDDVIDTQKTIDVFRQALYTLQAAKNDAAYTISINPKMTENFLSANFNFGQEMIDTDDGARAIGDELNAKGYRDAKISTKCFITPDGELPYTEENKKWCDENMGGTIVGPSLKAVGFMHKDGSDLTTPELTKVVERCDAWDAKWAQSLEDEENKMRDVIDYIHELEQHPNYSKNSYLRGVVSEWITLIEEFGSLQSLVILPMEALNKRDAAKDLQRYGRMAGDESYGVFSRNSANGGLVAPKAHMNEEATVLHDFGNHPGYRKKPMKHPEATEVALNGARDWNDDSTKGSEPFGKQIGSSAPYDKLIDEITKRVVKALGGMNK